MTPKSSTRKLKLQTPSPTASWRDEPAVKLKPVELDHSFMQIAVLLLEPEDSQDDCRHEPASSNIAQGRARAGATGAVLGVSARA